MKTFEGILSINNFGNGFVNCDNNTVIFVPKKNINYALHNDKVSGIIEKNDKSDQSVNDKKDNKDDNIGIITSEPSFLNKTYYGKLHHIYKNDLYIYIEKLGKSNIVIVENVFSKEYNILSNINKKSCVIITINSIDYENKKIYGIINNFYKDLDNDIFSKMYNLEEIKCENYNKCPKPVIRFDLYEHNVFTIDPIGSKDLDDAFSVIKCDKKENCYKIYVHIADVTEYIYPEHELFYKIMNRGNTIYGINYNWPMIPRELSDNICSILPDINTCAITNEFYYDMNDNTITHIGYYYSNIRSKKKYSYEDIDAIINNNFIENVINNKDIKILLESSNQISKILNVIPMNNSTSKSHKMIENWMIYTNNIIGNILSDKKTGIFRYHPKPYNNQLLYIKNFITNIFKEQIPQNCDKDFIINICKNNINEITDKNSDKNLEKDIIYTYEYIVKSMMRKATYKSCKNTHSHYALNLQNYLHFTSPIRRAPDIINHLILRGYTFDDSVLDNYCDFFDKSETIQLEIENIILKNTIFNNISEKIGEKINGIIINIQQNFIEVYLPEIESTVYIHVSKLSNKKLIFNDNILSNEDDTYKLFQINKYFIKDINIDIIVEIDK